MNPYLEPGLERYWVPSNAESALFGTKMCDLHVPVRPGGDVGLRQRRAEAAHRARRGRRRRSSPRTPRAGPSSSPRSTTSAARPSCSARPASPSTELERSSTSTPRPTRAMLVWSMGITQHRDAVDGVRAIVNVGAGAGQRRPRRRRAHADPRPLGRAGRRRDGRVRHRVPRRRRRSTTRPPPSCRGQWGFAVPARAGPHRARDGRGRGARRARRAVRSSAATSSTCCPIRRRGRGCARARAAARAPGHRASRSQMLVAGRRRDPAAGRAPATSRRAAAPRPRPSAASSFSPEIPAPGRRGAQRVAALRRRRRAGAARSGRSASRGRPTRRCATEIAAVVPAYAGIEDLGHDRRRRCSGAAATCAPDGVFPTADGRARFTSRRAHAPDVPEGAVHASPPGGASSSTRWCCAANDPLTGAGRDAVYIDRDDAHHRGIREGDNDSADIGDRISGGHGQARAPSTIDAAGPLARGQRAHCGRTRSPRTGLPGSGLQRRCYAGAHRSDGVGG